MLICLPEHLPPVRVATTTESPLMWCFPNDVAAAVIITQSPRRPYWSPARHFWSFLTKRRMMQWVLLASDVFYRPVGSRNHLEFKWGAVPHQTVTHIQKIPYQKSTCDLGFTDVFTCETYKNQEKGEVVPLLLQAKIYVNKKQAICRLIVQKVN